MTELDFNVFVGSETGFLKGVNLNQKSVITKNFDRNFLKGDSRQVASLFWNDPSSEDEIVVGFQNKQICLFDTTCNCYTWVHSLHFGDGPLVSVFRKCGVTVTAFNSGEVVILRGNDSTIVNTLSGNYSDRNTKKPTLSSSKPNLLHSSEFATGGCENDLAVWDINNSTTPVFRAKNVKADQLELRVPIWISDLTYLPNSNSVAVSSRHKHIRLYDPKAQRRPVINFEWEDNPLTCIAAVPSSDKQIVIGANHGRMALFDFRRGSTKTPVHTYKSFVGAVKNIAVHESLPLVFSVSLDRFIRVHNLQNKNVIYKHFLKSRLNCLLVRKQLKKEDFQIDDQPMKTKIETFGNEIQTKRRKIS